MRASPHHPEGERGGVGLLRGHLLLETLCIALISQDLLFLERLLSESNLDFDYRAFINNAGPRLTLIDKELVAGNLDCLALFKVAHQATKEVRLQDLVLYQLDRLVGLAIRLVECFLGGPDWGDPHNPHTLGHT